VTPRTSIVTCGFRETYTVSDSDLVYVLVELAIVLIKSLKGRGHRFKVFSLLPRLYDLSLLHLPI
jgi:hypothetical protein